MEKRFSKEEKNVRVHPNRLDIPLKRKKPTVWAIWNDLFHEDVPFSFTIKVSQSIWAAGRERKHIFLLLTKRIKRAAEFFRKYPYSAFPNNPHYWLGITVCNQAEADEKIPLLLQIPAAVRWVSYEPALGPLNLKKYFCGNDCEDFGLCQMEEFQRDQCSQNGRIGWLICGGETGPGARPVHPDWAKSVRDQCQAAGVPFFFKSWGEWAPRDNPNAYTGWAKHYQGDEWIDGIDKKENTMFRIGKKAAGRLLDGREWNELPQRRNDSCMK